MKEIKFRAWDKGTSTMKYPKPYDNGIGICPEELKGKFCPSELIDINGHQSHISDVLMNSDLYIPMQYTGLKDKNGKDIYEGDIVKLDDVIQRICHIEWDEEWSRFKCRDIEDNGNIKPYIWNQVLRIIGNIYENPELLKE
jgi:uncharacterized phage protein (TIGR01671 family)